MIDRLFKVCFGFLVWGISAGWALQAYAQNFARTASTAPAAEDAVVAGTVPEVADPSKAPEAQAVAVPNKTFTFSTAIGAQNTGESVQPVVLDMGPSGGVDSAQDDARSARRIRVEFDGAVSEKPSPKALDLGAASDSLPESRTNKALGAMTSGPGSHDYLVGVNDVLEVSVLQPEVIARVVRVAPDGTIAFPFIGNVPVKDATIPQIQNRIHDALADGYFKYPVVLVSLQETHSTQYMVYGEVNRPGAYPIDDYSTVLRAISMAGGFTKFGSSSRVKVLRPRSGLAGYDTIKIDINRVMSGDSSEDILLEAGDMVVVSEGIF